MLNILFDATVLVDGDDMIEERRGIYFIAKKLLEEFDKRDDCQIFLYADKFKLAGLRKISSSVCQHVKPFKNADHFDRYMHRVVTFFRRKRMDNFTRPLVRKFFACWVLLFAIVSNAVYFFKEMMYKPVSNMVFFSPRTAASGFLKCQKSLKKFIVLHDLIPYVLPEYANQRNWGWFGYLTRNLNQDDYYFAISQATKNDYCEFSNKIDPQKVFVTPWAADSKFRPDKDAISFEKIREKYAIPFDKRFIFSLCTLEPRKNLPRTVRTFLSFIRKNGITDLVFVIGGGEWMNFKKEMERQVEDAAFFEKNVVHIGYVSDEDLPVLYSHAEWFVFTSRYEGFGLPPLEAMQCGCPVITSNNSSLPEVVGDAGIMVDWDSDEQHVAAYEKYYFNDALRHSNAQKGMERTRLFSWEKTIDKIMKVMNRE